MRRTIPLATPNLNQSCEFGLSNGILGAVAGGGVGFGAGRIVAMFAVAFFNFHRPSEVGSLGRTLLSRFLWVGFCGD